MSMFKAKPIGCRTIISMNFVAAERRASPTPRFLSGIAINRQRRYGFEISKRSASIIFWSHARTFMVGSIVWGFLGLARPAGGEWLLHVSYDPTRELYRAMNKAFIAEHFERTGVRIAVRQSHSGSAGQARAVNEGLPADVVSLAIPPDL